MAGYGENPYGLAPYGDPGVPTAILVSGSVAPAINTIGNVKQVTPSGSVQQDINPSGKVV